MRGHTHTPTHTQTLGHIRTAAILLYFHYDLSPSLQSSATYKINEEEASFTGRRQRKCLTGETTRFGNFCRYPPFDVDLKICCISKDRDDVISENHLTSEMFLRRKLLSTGSLLILILNLFTGEAVTCRRAEYRIGEECCPMCPAGKRVHKHCTEYTSTSCTPCTEGTFLDDINQFTRCVPCTACKEGAGLKVKRSCTTTSDTHCEPLEGYYCTDLTQDGCRAAQKHRSCKPGQYISQRGTAASDTVCIDCTGETYSDGTFTSCQPHTICESGLSQIKPGNHSTDSECRTQSTTIPSTTIPSTRIIIIIIIPIIVLVVISSVVIWCLIKRKKLKVKRNPKADIRLKAACKGNDIEKNKTLKSMITEGVTPIKDIIIRL